MDVSKIHGYSIKDATARAQAETVQNNLTALENNFDALKAEIKIIPISGVEGETGGDCTLIVFDDGKSCLIDSHRNSSKNNIAQALSDNGITKLNYCMVSHYHADHVNGFIYGDFANYVTNETVFILPEDVPSDDSRVSDIYSKMQLVKQNIATWGCQTLQPTSEKQKLIINDHCYFEFYNVAHSDYYESEDFDYNNCSLCAKLYFHQNTAFFTGDLGAAGQRKLMGTVGNVSVYKAHHHGWDLHQNGQWLEEVNPEIVYVCCPPSTDISTRQFVIQMAKMGKSVYSTSVNGTFTITMTANSTHCTAKGFGMYNQITSIDILLNGWSNEDVFTADLQAVVDAIPFNTEVDTLFMANRLPNLFNGLSMSIATAERLILQAYKYQSTYFVVYLKDAATGVQYMIPVVNGTIGTPKRIITEDELYYKDGDTYSSTGYMLYPADIAGSGKILRFEMAVPKKLDKITSITINNLTLTGRSAKGLLNSASSGIDFTGSGYTVTYTIRESQYIYVSIASTNAFTNVDDNTNLTMYANNVNITFNE